MTDRELLETAAKAAGLKWSKCIAEERASHGLIALWLMPDDGSLGDTAWNPLFNSGDALKLAQRLAIEIKPSNRSDYGQTAGNISVCRDDLTPMEALRRAIVMAAAEIGRQMK